MKLKVLSGNVTFASGARALARKDPVMRSIIRRVGPIELPSAHEPFPALVRSILNQQLAGAAASAILGRFLALYSKDGTFPTPQALLRTRDHRLHEVGISRQKVSYLKDLATKFAHGTLSDELLFTLPDQELEAALMSVKGIGRWTADIFLIFTLHRLDVLPVDDLGLRKAAQRAYGLSALPTPGQLSDMGERWKPYRSIASLYLWHNLDGP
jgi:DNA-3-methyladenine glycosylase II